MFVKFIIQCCLAFVVLNHQTAAQTPEELLIEEAVKAGAPFVSSALSKLHVTVFGQAGARAARTTDVTITNQSNSTFMLMEHKCYHGSFSSGLLPYHKILPHVSVVYGVQCTSFLVGVNYCELEYKSKSGEEGFMISTSNPYIGRNSATKTSSGVQVTETVGAGQNNMVRFVIH